ncbi:MAG TPA: hypothetical protein PK504_08470 [Ferruginibacter sp.]|nr:hypothetical protein [Ferruginibacter sp.]HRE64432.1 hypothetical protein [Ferruginibacter sp.]
MASPFFKTKIVSFAPLLEQLGSTDEAMSAYSNRYLQYLIRHKIYYLNIYATVLELAIQHSQKSIEEISLIDYGSGNGLLGMFAKYCGCKKVFLCDTAINFIEASKNTAAKLQLQVDGFIHGGTDDFKNNFPEEKIDCTIGTDVIEHIYNLSHFFSSLKQLNSQMVTVFTTASNPKNFLKLRKLIAMQLHDELEGGHPSDFELAGEESHLPYLQMRKNIIETMLPGLPENIILKLAQLTRGKIKDDIEAEVQRYHTLGEWPAAPQDLWNTCHPITGSWSERILTLNEYNIIYSAHGFQLELSNGFYDAYGKTPKHIFNYFRNLLIKIMGIKIAPFITLTGFKKN